MSDEVPAQVIVEELFKSRPMVGKTTPMDCWSIKVIRRADASALKTTSSRPVGRMLVWSWNVGSGLAILPAGSLPNRRSGTSPGCVGVCKGRTFKGEYVSSSAGDRAKRFGNVLWLPTMMYSTTRPAGRNFRTHRGRESGIYNPAIAPAPVGDRQWIAGLPLRRYEYSVA